MKCRWFVVVLGLAGCTSLISIPPDGDGSGPRDLLALADRAEPVDLTTRPDARTEVDLMSPTDLGMPEEGLVLRGTFTGGGVMANAGTWALRGGFVWHGAIAGSAGGYVLRGWLR